MKRCPWCGKKIDCRYDSRRVKQNKLPRFFLFARCSNCDKYYGQAVFTSVYMKIMFYLINKENKEKEVRQEPQLSL